jgi:polar amino acid transport system substrate-binding protein
MPDDPEHDIREKLIGFGEKSIHKSYFPQLRKRLEELELFHALLDHANDLVFLLDTNSGVVLEANLAAYKLLGFTRVDLGWKSLLNLFTLASHSPLRNGLGAMEDGETHEVLHVRPSGQRMFFELTLSSMTINGHRYTVGVARDITTRKQTEDALRESELQLRTLFEEAPIGIYTATTEGRYLSSNPANAAIHGCDSPEELMATVTDLTRDIYVDPARRETLVRRLRQEGAVKSFECLRKKKDGSPVWVSTSARLTKNPVTGQEIINGFSIDFTERRKAEQETQEAKDFLNQIVNSVGDPIFVKDDGHRLILINDALCILMGRPREDILERTDYDFFPKEQADGFWKYDNEVLETGEQNVTEEELTDASGTTHTIVTKKTRYIDGRGQRFVVGVIRDITARKQTELALQNSERKLASLMRNLPGMVYSCFNDADWTMTFVSEGAVELTGYSYEDLVQTHSVTYAACIHEADRDMVRTTVEEAVARHQPFQIEYRIRTRDGREKTVLERGLGVFSPEGLLLHLEGFIWDITERKQAERELEASEEKFRSIVESSPTAMYFYRLEADGRLVLTGVNPAADSVMGFPHQALLGKTLEAIFPGLDGTHVPGLFRQVARGEIGPQSYQGTYQDERVSAHHDVHVFRTGPDAIAVDILDVTERVRLQEMMIQSEKMASVGGLAAGMAHEINNPLSSILQAAQVSLMQLDPDVPANRAAAEECGCSLEVVRSYLEKRRVLKFLDGIQEAGKRAAQIVASMLEFSRKSDSRRAPADINAILDKSVELASTDYDLKKKYDFRHIDIVRHYDPTLPEVNCTRTEIEQVILNLLKNAAQAMAGHPPRQGAPTIVLRTARGAGTVRIEVADNGPGMAESVRRRVFEPFFTTKEPGQGTGLGLSVSYFIITSNHGGTIIVESEPGEGARFIIELPVEEKR